MAAGSGGGAALSSFTSSHDEPAQGRQRWPTTTHRGINFFTIDFFFGGVQLLDSPSKKGKKAKRKCQVSASTSVIFFVSSITWRILLWKKKQDMKIHTHTIFGHDRRRKLYFFKRGSTNA